MRKKTQSIIAVALLISFSSLLVGCANTPSSMRTHPFYEQKVLKCKVGGGGRVCSDHHHPDRVEEFAGNAAETTAFGALYGMGIVAGIYVGVLVLMTL